MKKYSGHTLIEVLVVLVIISIVSTIAVLRIGHNRDKEIEAIAKTITASFRLAEEEALLKSATLSLHYNATHFGFYEYHDSQAQASWQAMTDTLGLHTLPKGITLELKTADTSSDSPVVIISSNGTLSPFILYIRDQYQKPRYQVRGESDGTVFYEPYSK